jgi:hypothetical protein
MALFKTSSFWGRAAGPIINISVTLRFMIKEPINRISVLGSYQLIYIRRLTEEKLSKDFPVSPDLTTKRRIQRILETLFLFAMQANIDS